MGTSASSQMPLPFVSGQVTVLQDASTLWAPSPETSSSGARSHSESVTVVPAEAAHAPPLPEWTVDLRRRVVLTVAFAVPATVQVLFWRPS